MNARFLLLSAALMVASPAQATVYLTVEQAQQLMFPGGSFQPDFRSISDEQAASIERRCGVATKGRQLKVWRVSGGGWFMVDEVIGDHDFIPFAVALDDRGAVKSVEILEYSEYVGGDVRNPKWLAQFIGKQDGTPMVLDKDIQNISGATLSSQHVTDGVRRLLAAYAILLAHR
ncbi:MAG: FMN-binding protein [Telmatospirillum sp.]|nr:FMN-binding protein [Telmatospirillum sp.]